MSTHPLSSCNAARARPHHHDSRAIPRSTQAGLFVRSRPRDSRVDPWRAARAPLCRNRMAPCRPTSAHGAGLRTGRRTPKACVEHLVVTRWSPPEMRARMARTAVSARESGPRFRAPSAALSRVALGFARPEGRRCADLPREGKATPHVPEMPSTNPNRPSGRPVPPGEPGGLSDRRVPLVSLCLGPLDAGTSAPGSPYARSRSRRTQHPGLLQQYVVGAARCAAKQPNRNMPPAHRLRKSKYRER